MFGVTCDGWVTAALGTVFEKGGLYYCYQAAQRRREAIRQIACYFSVDCATDGQATARLDKMIDSVCLIALATAWSSFRLGVVTAGISKLYIYPYIHTSSRPTSMQSLCGPATQRITVPGTS